MKNGAFKTALYSVMVCAAICFMAVGPPGCASGDVGTAASEIESRAREALAYKVRIDEIVARVESGELANVDAVSAIRAIALPEHVAAIDRAVQGGEAASSAAKRISEAVGVYANLALAHAEHLKAVAARDSPSPAEGIFAFLQGITPLLGPYGVVAGAVLSGVGLVLGKRSGRKEGEVAGAAKVAAVADIDGEVFTTISNTHPHLAATVLEFRDWHLDPQPSGHPG
jgi:hypothetical protein